MQILTLEVAALVMLTCGATSVRAGSDDSLPGRNAYVVIPFSNLARQAATGEAVLQNSPRIAFGPAGSPARVNDNDGLLDSLRCVVGNTCP